MICGGGEEEEDPDADADVEPHAPCAVTVALLQRATQALLHVRPLPHTGAYCIVQMQPPPWLVRAMGLDALLVDDDDAAPSALPAHVPLAATPTPAHEAWQLLL